MFLNSYKTFLLNFSHCTFQSFRSSSDLKYIVREQLVISVMHYFGLPTIIVFDYCLLVFNIKIHYMVFIFES
jgi:hypothetical protein